MKFSYLVSKVIKKAQLSAIENSIVHKTSKIASASHVVDTEIGKYTYIGSYCTVIQARIGNFCSIADNCIIGGANHPIHWGSTSPVFHNGKNIMRKNFSKHPYNTTLETIIGSDVWIGSNCLIKSGLNIGNGAVIGMGSVLTKDVGAYEIWAGNPARLIRKRFSDEKILIMQNSKWWEKNDHDLERIAETINNIDVFTKNVE